MHIILCITLLDEYISNIIDIIRFKKSNLTWKYEQTRQIDRQSKLINSINFQAGILTSTFLFDIVSLYAKLIF